jgi:hypothetical protein
VLVCRAGGRAHQAQEKLEAAGVPTLPILEGGMLAWQHADGEIVQDVIRWDLERQVRFTAGAIVLLSILVSVVFPPARFVAGFVGAGLVFAAVTNTCGMAMVLSKLPYNQPRSQKPGGAERPRQRLTHHRATTRRPDASHLQGAGRSARPPPGGHGMIEGAPRRGPG